MKKYIFLLTLITISMASLTLLNNNNLSNDDNNQDYSIANDATFINSTITPSYATDTITDISSVKIYDGYIYASVQTTATNVETSSGGIYIAKLENNNDPLSFSKIFSESLINSTTTLTTRYQKIEFATINGRKWLFAGATSSTAGASSNLLYAEVRTSEQLWNNPPPTPLTIPDGGSIFGCGGFDYIQTNFQDPTKLNLGALYTGTASTYTSISGIESNSDLPTEANWATRNSANFPERSDSAAYMGIALINDISNSDDNSSGTMITFFDSGNYITWSYNLLNGIAPLFPASDASADNYQQGYINNTTATVATQFSRINDLGYLSAKSGTDINNLSVTTVAPANVSLNFQKKTIENPSGSEITGTFYDVNNIGNKKIAIATTNGAYINDPLNDVNSDFDNSKAVLLTTANGLSSNDVRNILYLQDTNKYCIATVDGIAIEQTPIVKSVSKTTSVAIGAVVSAIIGLIILVSAYILLVVNKHKIQPK